MLITGAGSSLPEEQSPRNDADKALLPLPVETLEVSPLLYGFQVTWVPVESVLPLTRYRLFRRDGDSTPSLIAELGSGARSYCDFSATGRIRYSYSIVAANPLGEGPASIEVSAPARFEGKRGDIGE